MLQMDNNEDKWEAGFQYYLDHPDEMSLPAKPAAGQGDIQAWNKTKYTDSGGDNSKFGGWSDVGLAKYKELGEAVIESRKNDADRIKAVETVMLAAIRSLNGLTDADATAAQKRSNAKKRKRQQKAEAENRRAKIATMDLEFEE